MIMSNSSDDLSKFFFFASNSRDTAVMPYKHSHQGLIVAWNGTNMHEEEVRQN